MPWQAGVYIRQNAAGQQGSNVWELEEAGGFNIDSDRHDISDQDMADGISACLNKNGENGMLSNLAMGDNKITGLAAGTVNTDAVTKAQLDAVVPAGSDGDFLQNDGVNWSVSLQLVGGFGALSGAWIGTALPADADSLGLRIDGVDLGAFGGKVAGITAVDKENNPIKMDISSEGTTIRATAGDIAISAFDDVLMGPQAAGKGEALKIDSSGQIFAPGIEVAPYQGGVANVRYNTTTGRLELIP